MSNANTRNTTNGGVRKRNATVNDSKTTGNILNVSPPTPPPKSSSCCRYLSGFLAAIVVILSFAIVQETGVDGVAVMLSQLYQGGGDSYLDSAQHWQAARKQFTHDLAHIKTQFPNQSSSTWKMIGATLKSPLHPLPD